MNNIFLTLLLMAVTTICSCQKYGSYESPTISGIQGNNGVHSTRYTLGRNQFSYTGSTAKFGLIKSQVELANQYWHIRHCNNEALGSIDSMFFYRIESFDTLIYTIYDRYKIVYACDTREKSIDQYMDFTFKLLTVPSYKQLRTLDSLSYLDLYNLGEYSNPRYNPEEMPLAYVVSAIATSTISKPLRSKLGGLLLNNINNKIHNESLAKSLKLLINQIESSDKAKRLSSDPE